MAQELQERFVVAVERQFELPEFGLVPWAKKPTHELRWFQEKALEGFVGAKNGLGAVELATGLGKSLIIVHTLKAIGLSGVLVAPTLSIASQLLRDLTDAFGTRLVGQFFEGKKQPDKMFVVAVSKSLMNCVDGDETTNLLRSKKILIGDESHLLPAESLSRVVLGLLGPIPYRFFLSGTQIRNDGADILLQGITGPIQLKMSVKEGVDQGFLSPLKFVQWSVRSDSKYKSDEPLKMNRDHLHANPLVYSHAANLINRAVIEKKRRVLVLVDEVGQFGQLVKAGMNLPVGFSHGPLDAKNKKDVPEQHRKSDPMDLVAAFDRGEFPVLVGSSCIGMGTDIKSADFIVDLMGLASEVRVRQSVGRGTRLFPGKTGTVYNDYCVENIDILRNQAKKRAAIFDEIYGPVIFMR
jgi:superfamily II DNA or RNA helicase